MLMYSLAERVQFHLQHVQGLNFFFTNSMSSVTLIECFFACHVTNWKLGILKNNTLNALIKTLDFLSFVQTGSRPTLSSCTWSLNKIMTSKGRYLIWNAFRLSHILNQSPAGKPFGNMYLISHWRERKRKKNRLQMSVHKCLKACHKT